TVSALDAFGNVDMKYVGLVTWLFTDTANGVLEPADYNFTGADAGVHTFTSGARLVKAGMQTITASDTSDYSLTASALTTVTPAPANHFDVSIVGKQIGGTPFSFSVTALDPYNNVDTNYAGIVALSTSDSDPGVLLPSTYSFEPTDRGVHVFAGVV